MGLHSLKPFKCGITLSVILQSNGFGEYYVSLMQVIQMWDYTHLSHSDVEVHSLKPFKCGITLIKVIQMWHYIVRLREE